MLSKLGSASEVIVRLRVENFIGPERLKWHQLGIAPNVLIPGKHSASVKARIARSEKSL